MQNRKWWGLAALTLAAMMVGLDMTVLNIALPKLAAEFNASTGQLQWFINSYTLSLSVFMLPAGLLGDRFGRKKLLLMSFVLFAASSLFCAWAGSSTIFISSRVLMGIAAAFVITLSTGILPAIFPEKERSKAVAIVMTGVMLSLPIGPLLGGWMLDHFWWGWIFLINIPVIAITALAVICFLPESYGQRQAGIDFAGIALASIGLLSLSYGTIEAGGKGWTNGIAASSCIAGVLFLFLFILRQNKTRNPLIDMKIFHSARFRWSLFLAVLLNVLLFGMLFVVPQYFQIVLHTDAFGSGLRLLTLIAGLVFGGLFAETALSKWEPKRIILLGFLLITGGTVTGAFTSVTSSEWMVGSWLFIFGLGMGFAMPTAMDLALGALPSAQSGMGSSVIQTARNVGGSLGVAILGSILNAGYRSHLQLEAFPTETKTIVHDSYTRGIAAIQQGAPPLLDHLYESFMNGMDLMLWGCFTVAAAGLFCTMFLLPSEPKN